MEGVEEDRLAPDGEGVPRAWDTPAGLGEGLTEGLTKGAAEHGPGVGGSVGVAPPEPGPTVGSAVAKDAGLASPAIPPADAEASRGPRCQFLAVPAGGELVPAAEGPTNPAHLCTALGDARPVSIQQQDLVCLRAAHSHCPLYRRGVLEAVPVAVARPRSLREIPKATLAAAVILACSVVLAAGFAVARGGLSMPPGASATPSPAGPAQPAPNAVADSPDASLPDATLSADDPSALPSSDYGSPAASESAASTPGADRLALLQPCPGQPDCYVYVIDKGDSLLSVAKFFGVPYRTLLERNPQIKNPAIIHVGERITLPTPTR